ncbi:MAG TPA: hypothetical protein VEK76_06140 [Candidatus Binatia bacterium]|nr:hypothetical protein [Candidatus Binatia bacterium]
MTTALIGSLGGRLPSSLRSALLSRDWTARVALSFDELVFQLTVQVPDVVVLHLRSGGVAALVDEVAGRTPAPIIVISSSLAEGVAREAALDAGASHCLVPSASPDEVRARIRAAVRRGRGAAQDAPVQAPMRRAPVASRRRRYVPLHGLPLASTGVEMA